MIRFNLSVLLAERNLKITKVSKDTGISRTTLTSLASNNSKGIQFDTINTLCKYLSINPEDLFSYIPFDIVTPKITSETKAYPEILENQIIIQQELIEAQKNDTTHFCIVLNFNTIKFITGNTIIDILIEFYTYKIENFKIKLEAKNYYIKNLIESLPVSFRKDFEEDMIDQVILHFADLNINTENYTYKTRF